MEFGSSLLQSGTSFPRRPYSSSGARHWVPSVPSGFDRLLVLTAAGRYDSKVQPRSGLDEDYRVIQWSVVGSVMGVFVSSLLP